MEDDVSRGKDALGLHLPDMNKKLLDKFTKYPLDAALDSTWDTKAAVISSPDMDPTWEFDVQAGALLEGDMLRNEYGEIYAIIGGKLTRISNESAQALEPARGQMKRIASTYAENPEKVELHKTGGLLDYIKESNKPTYHSPLSMDMFKRAIESINNQPPQGIIIHSGRQAGKSLKQAMEAQGQSYQNQVMNSFNDDGKRTKYELSLLDDELAYDLTLEDRRSMLESYVHDEYGKGELSHSGFEEKMDAIAKWYHSKTPHSTSNSGTITDAHTILLHPASSPAKPRVSPILSMDTKALPKPSPEQAMKDFFNHYRNSGVAIIQEGNPSGFINPPPPYPGGGLSADSSLKGVLDRFLKGMGKARFNPLRP